MVIAVSDVFFFIVSGGVVLEEEETYPLKFISF